jgi:alkylation response protein AidB-like acyl-CoA dehydrogenase
LDLKMFLLPPRLREMFEKKRLGLRRDVFARDDQLRRTVREMAVAQRRAERDVYDDLIESGMKALVGGTPRLGNPRRPMPHLAHSEITQEITRVSPLHFLLAALFWRT